MVLLRSCTHVIFFGIIFLLATTCGRSSSHAVVSPEALVLERKDLINTPFTIDSCQPPYCGIQDNKGASRDYNDAQISLIVFRDYSDSSAKQRFIERRTTLFSPTPFIPFSPFLTPPSVTYRSPIADDFYVACGVNLGPECITIARYGLYVIQTIVELDQWRTDTQTFSGNGLSIDTVDSFLRLVDQRVNTQLHLGSTVMPQTFHERKGIVGVLGVK